MQGYSGIPLLRRTDVDVAVPLYFFVVARRRFRGEWLWSDAVFWGGILACPCSAGARTSRGTALSTTVDRRCGASCTIREYASLLQIRSPSVGGGTLISFHLG